MAGVPSIPLGISSPNSIGLTINQGDSNLDLTSVTGLTLNVTRAIDGTTAAWVCTIVTKTSTQLQALYSFDANGQDVPVLGIYEVAPEMTVPGGVVPGYAFRFQGVLPGECSYRNT